SRRVRDGPERRDHASAPRGWQRPGVVGRGRLASLDGPRGLCYRRTETDDEEHAVKAAVLYERRRPLVIADLDLVRPGAGEVEIDLVASGVCHSDLHHVQRDTTTALPVVLGHEGAGIVKAVGSNVTRLQPGDHVIIGFVEKCVECYYCLRLMPYLCT